MYNKYIGGLFRVTILLFALFGLISLVSWGVNRSIKAYELAHSAPAAMSLKERERQLSCLTQNIYWEAAGESFEGKVAVAQVTLNRASNDSFPKDVCQVVYQKNVFYKKVVCQFSWYCENNHKVKPVHQPMYEESEAVARKVLLEGFRLDSLKDALYYHADYVNPKWRKERVAVIGRHIFYK